MINDTIAGIIFRDFDVVLFSSGKRAIYFDGRFYFSEDWCYTTQDSIANEVIYIVKKVLRPNNYKGDAFRFLQSDHVDSFNLTTIYDRKKICSRCGQTIPGGK